MRGYVFPVIPEETISEKNFTRNLRSTFSINTFSEQKTIKFSESNWSSMTINLLFKRHAEFSRFFKRIFVTCYSSPCCVSAIKAIQ